MPKIISEITFARAAAEDMAEILELQKAAFRSEAELYNNFKIEPLIQTLESISSDFAEYVFLKAVFNDKIVGSVKARITPEGCWIGRLIVHPDFQNKGIGRRLMLEIEKQFNEVKSFLLCTGYKSFKNISLYESIGYKKADQTTDEGLPGIHLVKMIKTVK